MLEQYKNCTIKILNIRATNIKHNTTGDIYSVSHNKTHNIVHAISYGEACRLASLLDLESAVSNVVRVFNGE